MKKALTHAERHAIAGEAMVSYNTVLRWERGEKVQPISLYRIKHAIDRINSTRGKAAK